jgi:hypothetical protein
VTQTEPEGFRAGLGGDEMSLDLQRLKHAAAARDNPAGRAYEVKVAYYQGFALILGCIGVVLAFPPLIYLAAAGVLLTGFMAAIVNGSGSSQRP